MRKIIVSIFTLATIFALSITASAASTITISEVSGTTSQVELSGTTNGVKAAVMVQIVNENDVILSMESVTVKSDGSFSAEISDLSLTDGATYTAKIADYDGGKWVTMTFVAKAPYVEPTPITYPVVISQTVKEETTDEAIEFENCFVDVYADDYYYDAVMWAAQNNITDGTDATHFSPDASCTRAQMVSFLWRAAGSPEPQTTVCSFTDVKANQYYYKAVLWAVENGITDGTSTSTFSPDEAVTRAQTVTFLWRYKGKPVSTSDNSFSDIVSGKYYYNAVLWAKAQKITDGTGKNMFSPDADCTRAQIVTFIYRSETN